MRFYSISSQIMKMRNEYYDILEAVQKCELDITDWLLWFLKCLTESINNSKKVLDVVIFRVKFWQKYSEVYLNERQRKVLNALLEAEPDGFFGGLTTKKYISMTKTSRATAYREILYMLEKKILCQLDGQGRNVKYGLLK